MRSPARDSDYPGQHLGLPETGAGSVAGIGRRLGGLVIDWLLCTVIALAAVGSYRHTGNGAAAEVRYLTLAVFAAEVWLLTALTGFTVGKRLLGMRVIRLDGKPVGLIWSLVRTILLVLVIPAVIFDADLRGLHDKAANTVVIRI